MIWINWAPPTAGGSGGDRWQNYRVTITRPDGTNETKGPYTSDATSSTYFLYTPTKLGTYTFEFKFPGQVASLYNPVNGQIAPPDVSAAQRAYVNDTFSASSATTTLTVQQDPAQTPPEYPLPTSYWTRPIEAQNTAWENVASNWLGWGSGQIQGGGGFGGGGYQPTGVAPNSPHIMWTKPLTNGGIVGGKYAFAGGMSYYMGLSYEGRFSNPLVMYGKLYYDTPISDSPNLGPYTAVDLRTGETLWTNNNIAPAFGQLYMYDSPNQHGVIPDGYLWQTSGFGTQTWTAWDPTTGLNLFNLTGVPPGTTVNGPNGEILRYVLQYNTTAKNGRLLLWNNTAAPGELLGTAGTNAWQWRPLGKVVDASTAYSWNVSITADLSGLSSPSILSVIPDDMILGTSSPWASFSARAYTPDPYTFWAISLKPSTRGQLLWIKNYTAPAGNLTLSIMGAPSSGSLNLQVDQTKRVFFLTAQETMQWWGYDLDSGNMLWGPVGDFRAFQYYGTTSNPPAPGYTAYGNLYVAGYGGILYAFESRTGNLVWSYGNGGPGNSTHSGEETPWGHYPLFVSAIADGKIYAYSSEHSPNTPPYKGSRVRAIDAVTGREIWTMLGWYAIGGFGQQGGPVADGQWVYLNTYDMQIYSIGKGPSATTVSAPDVAVPKGSSVMIRGTVTDQSAGAKRLVAAGEFNSVPAMSDASQGPWMEYIHMQKPKPANATGVAVKLTAIDSSGVTTDIGTVTSDSDGMFKKMWQPPNEGEYTIVAAFEGSESYWPSRAATAIGVTAALPAPSPTATPTPPPTTSPPTATPTPSPSPSQPPPPEQNPNTALYVAIAAVVIIAVIAAVAIFMRRRK
jgi:hypothetical protein